MFNLVTTYQVHSHSKSCRKYKNKLCRYSFGNIFTDHTIVSEPLPDELSQQERNDILQQRESVLSKVKEYIEPWKIKLYLNKRYATHHRELTWKN